MSDPIKLDAPMLLDADEVAARIGVTRMYFRGWCAAGTFPAPDAMTGDGKGYRWRPETVQPWIDLHRQQRALAEKRREMMNACKGAWVWRESRVHDRRRKANRQAATV